MSLLRKISNKLIRLTEKKNDKGGREVKLEITSVVLRGPTRKEK
jgi:hypothetical protein